MFETSATKPHPTVRPDVGARAEHLRRELRNLPGVDDAAVVPVPSRLGNVLVAHLTPPSSATTTFEVRRALADRLPPALLPFGVVHHERLPITSGGAHDVDALVAASAAVVPAVSADRVAPRRGEELVLSGLWCELLGIEQIGLHDDLTELGADSLAFAEVAARLQDHHAVAVTPAELVVRPTISTQAELFMRPAGESPSLLVTLAEPPPEGHRLLCFPGGDGMSLTFAALARHLRGRAGVQVMERAGRHRRAVPDYTVGLNARRALSLVDGDPALRPDVLVGYSFGGLVAWEMARRLHAIGRPPRLVVLLDPRSRSLMRSRRDVDRRAGAGAGPAGRPPSGRPTSATFLGARRGRASAVRRAVGNVVRVATAGLVTRPPREQHTAFLHLSLLIGAIHRVKPYGGDVLIVSTRTAANGRPDDLGFASVATGRVEVVHVDATHVSMLWEPHVTELAGVVEAALDRLG